METKQPVQQPHKQPKPDSSDSFSTPAGLQEEVAAVGPRAAYTPHKLTPRDIVLLQRTIGNRATERLVRERTLTVRQRNPTPLAQHEGVLQKKPEKSISAVAMVRIAEAKEAIEHTKSVFKYGAGNQSEALKASDFNSYFRLQVMRKDKYWNLTDEVKPIAAANPAALTAAKADLVHGGNCGEHADVAYDYLQITAKGEHISLADVQGLDHAFVLIGDVPKETDAEVVAADPWPTQATATTWDDHFAYTADRTKLNLNETQVADGKSVKKVIAAGLTLSKAGKKLAQKKLTKEQTEASVKQGEEDGWVWDQADAAGEDKDFDYVSE